MGRLPSPKLNGGRPTSRALFPVLRRLSADPGGPGQPPPAFRLDVKNVPEAHVERAFSGFALLQLETGYDLSEPQHELHVRNLLLFLFFRVFEFLQSLEHECETTVLR